MAGQDLHANEARLGAAPSICHQVSAYISFEPLYHPEMLERLRQLRGQLRGAPEISMTALSIWAKTGVRGAPSIGVWKEHQSPPGSRSTLP